MQLQVSGQGNMGARGGVAGDLLVVIEEKPHEYFQREGQNLHYDLFVNFADAALGTQIVVPTSQEKLKLNLKKELNQVNYCVFEEKDYQVLMHTAQVISLLM